MFIFYTVVTTTVAELPVPKVACSSCHAQDSLTMSFNHKYTEFFGVEWAFPHSPEGVLHCDQCQKDTLKWKWTDEIKAFYQSHRDEYRAKGFFRLTKLFWIVFGALVALCVGLYLYEQPFRDTSGETMVVTIDEAISDIKPNMIFGLNIHPVGEPPYVTWIIIDEVGDGYVTARKYRSPLQNQSVNIYGSSGSRPVVDKDNFDSTPFKLDWDKAYHALTIPLGDARSDAIPEEWGKGGLSIWEVVSPASVNGAQ